MTRIFDGMSGILSGVFGGSVEIEPGGGSAVAIEAIFREEEVEVADDEGEAVLAVLPVLKAAAPLVAGLEDGDRVTAGGVAYRVRYRMPNPRPASDRLEVFVLRREVAP